MASIPITRKSKWFCGAILCWSMMIRCTKKPQSKKPMNRNEHTKKQHNNHTKNRFANVNWCWRNPDESYITIGNWQSQLNDTNAHTQRTTQNTAEATHWHINSNLQSKCWLRITTQITHKIPFVDLHMARSVHAIQSNQSFLS